MSQLSRRRFLEDSLLASAALAAGPLLTSASAQDQPAQSTSPAEKLSVAVIGVKGRGASHISAFAGRRDTEISYICDVDEAEGQRAVREVSQRQRAPQYVKDMRRLFEDRSVDIVSIATPNHWHSLCSIWAMQAGKDVYVEKPVSHNVSEGRRTVQAARKYNRICQTGTQCRSMGGTLEAINFIKAGRIGEVRLARGLCYKSRGSIGARGMYQPPATVDYDLWSGPAPILPLSRPRLHYDWHWVWAYGNGDLGNQGIHQMDIARWGLGVSGLGQSVLSYGGRLGYVDAGDTANTQVSIHNYGDKNLVFEVRGLRTQPLQGAGVGVIFYGSEGTVVLTSYTSGAAFDRNGEVIQRFNAGGDHFANFLSAVRSRRHADLAADIEEGHLSSALCHIGNISYRLGSPVTAAEARARLQALPRSEEAVETYERVTSHLRDNGVNLESTPLQLGRALTLSGETFTGSDVEEANRMLTREYRAPFVVPTEANV